MEPQGVDFLADGADVARGDGTHDEQADEDGNPNAGAADAEGVNHVHVGHAAQQHEQDGEHEHKGVKAHDEQDVVARDLARRVA